MTVQLNLSALKILDGFVSTVFEKSSWLMLCPRLSLGTICGGMNSHELKQCQETHYGLNNINYLRSKLVPSLNVYPEPSFLQYEQAVYKKAKKYCLALMSLPFCQGEVKMAETSSFLQYQMAVEAAMATQCS